MSISDNYWKLEKGWCCSLWTCRSPNWLKNRNWTLISMSLIFFSEIWKVGKVRFYVIFQVYSSTATNLHTILLARFCNFFNCTWVQRCKQFSSVDYLTVDELTLDLLTCWQLKSFLNNFGEHPKLTKVIYQMLKIKNYSFPCPKIFVKVTGLE